jgi:hypothetical protein
VSSALLHGLPVIAVIVAIALIYRRSGNQRPVYRLPQPWTHEPILWSATDEPVPAVRHDDHHTDHHTGGAVSSFGGGASGRW